jgi:hypothetical protein
MADDNGMDDVEVMIALSDSLAGRPRVVRPNIPMQRRPLQTSYKCLC